MWKFGPDQVWEDKGVLFIRTPRVQEDWTIREYRKTMLRFHGKSYYPAQVQETGKQMLYRFEPLDPTLEIPGLTMDYDAEYVKVREGNRNRPLYSVLLILAVGCVLLIGWKVLQGNRSTSQMVQSDGELITANNTSFDLEDFSGETVWLDFSAPWCGPCRAQAPHMKSLEESDLDVVFVTIIVSDTGRRRPSQETAETWVKKYGLNPDLVVADLTGDFSKEWKVQSIPLNVLISPSGKVLYRESGSHQASDVKRIISTYL